jgi:glyoxylase-like metal-dependent hydrolase (beta-lactamase superfamily II)
MTKKCLAVVALAVMFVSVAAAQDAKTVIADAQKAMGYTNLNSIEYSGPTSREGGGLGQWQSPTKGWHANTVQNFTRYIDYSAGTSQRSGLQSRPGDPTTGLLPGGNGLDPSTQPPAQNTQTIAATGTWVQRLEVTLSPPMFLKLAAAAPNATVKSQNMNGKKYNVVSFAVDQPKAPSGASYVLTGYINNQTKMLDKVETAYEDAAPFMFGDIVVEQTFSEYKDFNGVKFPTKILQSRAGVPFNDATIADAKANAAAPPLPPPPAARGGGGAEAAPGGGRGGAGGGAPGGGAQAGGGRGGAGGGAPGGGAPGAGAPGGGAPGAGAQAAGGRGGDGAAAGGGRGGGGAQAGGGRGNAAPPAPRKIAEGVFVLTNGYRALAVEFKDHIVLVEAPQGNIANLIEQAKQAIPKKPITLVVSTHLHFDHAGGLRTVAAEGTAPVTIVTNEMNKGYIDKWFSNPRTLQATVLPPAPGAAPAPAPAAGGRGGAAPTPWPDALQEKGGAKKVKFQYVKDKLVLKDDTRTLELHALKGALHGEDMIIAYLPKEKVIFESDAYNPGAPGAVTNPTANGGQLAFQKLLVAETDRLKLDYNTIISGHPPGDQRDATKQELLVAIGKAAAAAPAAPAPAAPAPARGQ